MHGKTCFQLVLIGVAIKSVVSFSKKLTFTTSLSSVTHSVTPSLPLQ